MHWDPIPVLRTLDLILYYTTLIKNNNEWIFAGIYADEGITGTQILKRDDFIRLMDECMKGNVDMIITKSISRFARNTLDTLKYVRKLKERGIAVYFEEEGINTLSMESEMALVLLSSVAQQEVENISAHVKKGLKMKALRGEMIGAQECLGYDYSVEKGNIIINAEEADIVRYIFRRYLEGAGATVIGHELDEMGCATKRGNKQWNSSTVLGILKNEKYRGDVLMGKTYTVDPISKRRMHNYGEEDQYRIANHHEPIISPEEFEAAQQILEKRGRAQRLGIDGEREKLSRKYAFSSMLRCGFCGKVLVRRSWHASSCYQKTIWQCERWARYGKENCPECKGIEERVIEQAFLDSYRYLQKDNDDVLNEFVDRVLKVLKEEEAGSTDAKVEKELRQAVARRKKLVDLRLDETLEPEAFQAKYEELTAQINRLNQRAERFAKLRHDREDLEKRVSDIRKQLKSGVVLENFNRNVFESIVDRVVVGGYDEKGKPDPYLLTFVYKAGGNRSMDGRRYRQPCRKVHDDGKDGDLCPNADDEEEPVYPNCVIDGGRDRRAVGAGKTGLSAEDGRISSGRGKPCSRCGKNADFVLYLRSRGFYDGEFEIKGAFHELKCSFCILFV